MPWHCRAEICRDVNEKMWDESISGFKACIYLHLNLDESDNSTILIMSFHVKWAQVQRSHWCFGIELLCDIHFAWQNKNVYLLMQLHTMLTDIAFPKCSWADVKIIITDPHWISMPEELNVTGIQCWFSTESCDNIMDCRWSNL